MDAASASRTTPGTSSARVRGRTLRFTWTDGPTAGTTHEHHFHADGTVDWRSVEATAANGTEARKERPEYFAADIGAAACFVSYLSSSGFTLSVVLDFDTRTIVGVASNDRQWVPVRGRVEMPS